jgi:hypothetical protein
MKKFLIQAVCALTSRINMQPPQLREGFDPLCWRGTIPPKLQASKKSSHEVKIEIPMVLIIHVCMLWASPIPVQWCPENSCLEERTVIPGAGHTSC